jgi:hypothetical protein
VTQVISRHGGNRPAGGDDSLLRLAVIGSPRSGNTWVRSMLKSLYGLEEMAADYPDEIAWNDLPRRCVIQIHWYPLEPFLRQIEEHQIRVVIPIRHPFDVLMSWLNYLYYVHQDGRCSGDCGACGLVGVLPRSEEFLEYAKGYPGRSLLCHGPAWIKWAPSMIHLLRYEDLVADAEAALGPLAEWVGEPFRRSVRELAAENAIDRGMLNRDLWQYHFWQGRPGLWRQMLTAAEARAIAERVPEPFEALSYECDPDPALGPAEADLNWLRLQLDSTREHLAIEKAKHRQTAKELATLRESLDPTPPRDLLRETSGPLVFPGRRPERSNGTPIKSSPDPGLAARIRLLLKRGMGQT